MYIFLDIDGVLNREMDWKKMYVLNRDCVQRFCYEYRNSRLILISSWKNGFISSMNNNNTPQIKRLEEMLFAFNIRILGKTETTGDRYKDVIEFIKLHPRIGDDYIVIDDDKKEYSQLFDKKHFKLVNSKIGYK